LSGNFESAAYLTLKKKRMQDRHSAAESPKADAHLTAILSGFYAGGCRLCKLHFRNESVDGEREPE